MEETKILIVDDEENILTIFRLILERSGYIVDTAATAEEALVKVRSNTFQLCLLDLNLPDMYGIELARQIQEIDPRVKKMMVTGDSSGDYQEEAQVYGINGFILKPLNKVALIRAVKDALTPT